jgi:hypothetical protein
LFAWFCDRRLGAEVSTRLSLTEQKKGVPLMPTLFEHAGGLDALHRLEETFYASVLKDLSTG